MLPRSSLSEEHVRTRRVVHNTHPHIQHQHVTGSLQNNNNNLQNQSLQNNNNQQQLKFKFQPVDETTWPFLRGVRVFKDLFRDFTQAERLSGVFSGSGHFGLILDKKIVWILDACIKHTNARLSDSQVLVLRDIVFGTLPSTAPLSEVVFLQLESEVLLVRFQRGMENYLNIQNFIYLFIPSF